MVKDDPFGLQADRGRTRIRPAAAGPSPAFAAAAAPRRARAHPNPLVSAFAALLEFAPELETARSPGDPEALRARLQTELVASRDATVAAGAPLARADAAAWAVAALLDDLALNTPWGGAGAWPRQPLVATLYGHVDAGAQFFDRLDALERQPARERDLLELHFLVLSLGFRGKYRVPGRAGDRSLAAVRAAAARALRDPEADAAPLSPNWQGVSAAAAPRRRAVPVWVPFAAAVLLATAIYAGFSMRLSGQATELATLVRALPPAERAEIFRTERGPENPGPIPRTELQLLPEFERAAPAGLLPALQGRESVSLTALVVQWSDPELFQSARATLTPGFEPLIEAIGQTIAANTDVIGGVTVVGHTDSIPVQATNPLSSNQRLSEARAETIAGMLLRSGVPADRLRAEGRAATEPVADNGTREGRALNRRVEILVEKRL